MEGEQELAEAPFPPFSLSSLLNSSQLLLASSGKEFAKPLESAKDVARARQEAMSRIGLSFFDDFGSEGGIAKDLENELAADMSEGGSSESPPTPGGNGVKMEIDPIPPASAAPQVQDDEKFLSKRELNRLKRKRKDGNAYVGAVASSSAAQLAKNMQNQEPVPK